MIIHNIAINGVGPFTKTYLEFSGPGINVILGENETGKSTLCKTIRAILYGFASKDEARGFRSWADTQDFSAEMRLSHNGEMYFFRREFDSDATIIRKVQDGKEIEIFNGDANPRGRTEEPRLYKKFLFEDIGIPPENILERSAYVGQLQLDVDLDEDLRQQLSGAGQGDYQLALKELKEKYYQITKESMPGTSDRNRRNNKRIETLNEAIQTHQGLLSEAEELYQENMQNINKLEEQQGRLQDLEEQHSSIADEISWLSDYLDQHKLSEAIRSQEDLQQKHLNQINKAKSKKERLKKELESERYQDFAALDEINRDQLLKYVQSDAEEVFQQIQTLKQDIVEYETDLDQDRYRIFAESDDETGRKIEDWLDREGQVAVLRETIAKKGVSSRADSSGRRQSVAVILLSLGAGILGGFIGYLASSLLSVALPPWLVILLGFLGLSMPTAIIAAMVVVFVRSKRTADEQERMLLDSRLREAELEQAQADPEIRAYIEYCEQNDCTMDILLDRWKTCAGIKSKLDKAQNELEMRSQREVLSIREDPVLQDIFTAYEVSIIKDRLDQFMEIRQKLSSQVQMLQQMESGMEVDEEAKKNKSELKDLQLRMSMIEEKYPTFIPYRKDVDAGRERQEKCKKKLEMIRAESDQISRDIRALQNRSIEINAQSIPEPAILREMITDQQDQLQRARLNKDALAVAFCVLENSIKAYEEQHIDLLAERTRANFEQLTLGKHTTLAIESAGSIQVINPQEKSIDPENLSAGTRDQLFLALRVAILDILSTEYQLPLILDDTFVNFDHPRREMAREVVQRIAADRQVLLLSHDPEYESWADNSIQL